jgi:hypothetical protein
VKKSAQTLDGQRFDCADHASVAVRNELGLPPSTVHQMLVASGLQPHRIRTLTFRPDPDFEAKLLDIVGL